MAGNVSQSDERKTLENLGYYLQDCSKKSHRSVKFMSCPRHMCV
jgi:hypothetical protein